MSRTRWTFWARPVTWRRNKRWETTRLSAALQMFMDLVQCFTNLLTGQPPFAGGTTYETIKLLLDTEPRQPRAIKSENRSRSLNNLSQVSRERSKAPLLFRSRAGRRSRTLAQSTSRFRRGTLGFSRVAESGCGAIQRARSWRRAWLH